MAALILIASSLHLFFTQIKDPDLTPTLTSFTQVQLAESWWSGGQFYVTDTKWGNSSDAIMDCVIIKFTDTPGKVED